MLLAVLVVLGVVVWASAALGLLCLVQARPLWLWVWRFHSARSLEEEADEGELTSDGKCGEEAL